MDAGRLSRGELIAGIAGLALFIVMFFSWFGAPGVAGDALDQAADLGIVVDLGLTANAWQAFDFIDLVLPAMRRRGIARDGYVGDTLRERFFGDGCSRLPLTHPGRASRMPAPEVTS